MSPPVPPRRVPPPQGRWCRSGSCPGGCRCPTLPPVPRPGARRPRGQQSAPAHARRWPSAHGAGHSRRPGGNTRPRHPGPSGRHPPYQSGKARCCSALRSRHSRHRIPLQHSGPDRSHRNRKRRPAPGWSSPTRPPGQQPPQTSREPGCARRSWTHQCHSSCSPSAACHSRQ